MAYKFKEFDYQRARLRQLIRPSVDKALAHMAAEARRFRENGWPSPELVTMYVDGSKHLMPEQLAACETLKKTDSKFRHECKEIHRKAPEREKIRSITNRVLMRNDLRLR